jgi:16S rRNA (guanine527-N7)-methyltransferase
VGSRLVVFPSVLAVNLFHLPGKLAGVMLHSAELFQFYLQPIPLVNPPDPNLPDATLSDNLPDALRRHNIELAPPQIARLDQYCQLLWDWNSKINLTRHADFEKFVSRDLVDSLVFARYLEPGENVLDVGAGGGVPGVVLAILRDDLRLSFSESVGKKAKALADMVEKLAIPAPVFNARAEDLLCDHRFNTLVIRAVARLRKLLEWFKPHWAAFDRMLILKGPGWIDERGEARHYGLLRGLALRKLESYPLPGTESESVLLQISPSTDHARP